MINKELEEFWKQVDIIITRSIENNAQSIFDNFIRENAKRRDEVGISPKIVRKLSGETCEWCLSLSGVYIYGEEPAEVYQRHDNCDCTVEYFCEKGRQNVYESNFRWMEENEYQKKERIAYLLSEGSNKNNFYDRALGRIKKDVSSFIDNNSYDKIEERKRIAEFIDFDYDKYKGSDGKLHPIKVHRKAPIKADPFAIYDAINQDGSIVRWYYDKNGDRLMRIDSTHHGFPKYHPIGGHKHSTIVNKIGGDSRRVHLTKKDRKENSDIL